jgi:TolA-binding protein
LAAAAAGSLWWASAASHVAPQGELARGRIEAHEAPRALRLTDGSSLELAPGSSLQVRGDTASAVSLALRRGRVSCDVTHVPGRKFSVVAADVEVRVVGTQFSVTSTEGAAPRVEVSVQRGVVEVVSARRPGLVARVVAGQIWVQAAGSSAPAAGAAPPFAEPPPAVAPPGAAVSSPAAKVEPASPPPSADAAVNVPSARELFEKAGEQRRAGDAGAAARAYEELLRLHPSDPRASLSAFELGRLRMDRLGDQAGAISAFERALASSLGPSFREDALARLVSAYAAQGNFAACGRARDRYLASYPAGVHASAVARRCGAP